MLLEAMLKKTSLLCVCAAALCCAWPFGSHAVIGVSAASAVQTAAAVQTATNDGLARQTYVLGPDDQIVIHAVDVPDISEKPQKLDRDGDLRLSMVGRVHAAGMTVAELERELTRRLK